MKHFSSIKKLVHKLEIAANTKENNKEKMKKNVFIYNIPDDWLRIRLDLRISIYTGG